LVVDNQVPIAFGYAIGEDGPMQGNDFLEALSKRMGNNDGKTNVSDSEMARHMGMSAASLAANWRHKIISPRMILDLIARREKRTLTTAISPIVEFYYLDPIETNQGVSWKLFSENDGTGIEHPYLAGLKSQLSETHGVYIFHDSRGRAIYVGKAIRQDLWTEMNLAFNRDRGEVQSIKRVEHPTSKIRFKPEEHGRRRITTMPVPLHEIASYVSVYEVSDELISILEAVLVRSFANDLLNVRMEKL
jgi:hypothetical protein